MVKEPYLKVMSDGDYGIRVDHLSDIMFIPKFDKLVPSLWRSERGSEGSAYDWKIMGNDFFSKSGYHFAIEW